MRWLLAALLGSWVGGCADDTQQTTLLARAPIRVVRQPEVLFRGCRDMHGETCLLPEAEVPLWVWVDTTPHAELSLTADGIAVASEATPVGGGVRLAFTVAPDVLELKLAGVDPTWSEPWRLTIERVRDSAAFVHAETLRLKQGDLEGAEAVITKALPGLEGADKLAALEWLANKDGTPKRRRKVIAMAEALGRPRTAARASSALFYGLAHEGQLDALEPLVTRVERAGEQVDEARLWAYRDRAYWAVRLGDPSEAIRLAEASARLSERLGATNQLVLSLVDLITGYCEVSDWDRARNRTSQLESLIATSTLSCDNRRTALNGIGWAQLSAARAGHDGSGRDESLEAALWLAGEDGDCPNTDEEVNIRVNLALSALQRGEPGYAARWLEPVIAPPSDLEPWVRDVRATAGIAMGRLDDVPSPVRIVDEVRLDDRYNAWVRQARVLEHIGVALAAADAWAQAEALVDERAAVIATGGARDHYVEGRLTSASGLVRSLVNAGDPAQALCRARLARGRLLRMLDHSAALSRAGEAGRKRWRANRLAYTKERTAALEDAADDWRFSEDERRVRVRRRREFAEQRATAALDRASRALHRRRIVARCEDLPPIGAGTVQLVFFPDDDGWWVFAADADGVDVAWADSLTAWSIPDTLAHRLIGAKLVRVVPTGEAWRLVIPSLVVGDQSLLDQAPIVYALDLEQRAQGSMTHAVVVADPTEDLAHARLEATGVATALANHGWTVDALEGRAATRDAVVASLANASVLHYAGHGRYRGDAGWESALVLHDGQALTVQDVLLLATVPSSVVLTGCETGATNADMLAGGMSLGRAFVLAGASSLVVANTNVDDRLAQQIGEALYANAGAANWTLATELRRVQLQLRRSQPNSSWASFRVIVP